MGPLSEKQLTMDELIAKKVEEEVEKRLKEKEDANNAATIILFSGELDKAIAAFNMAVGALAMGLEVYMYFTFWGCSVIRTKKSLQNKTGLQKLFNSMLPTNANSLHTSKFSFGGLGSKLLRIMMKGKMESLENMLKMCIDSGVHFILCSPSQSILGFDKEEFIAPVQIGGVAAMYEASFKSKVSFFI